MATKHIYYKYNNGTYCIPLFSNTNCFNCIPGSKYMGIKISDSCYYAILLPSDYHSHTCGSSYLNYGTYKVGNNFKFNTLGVRRSFQKTIAFSGSGVLIEKSFTFCNIDCCNKWISETAHCIQYPVCCWFIPTSCTGYYKPTIKFSIGIGEGTIHGGGWNWSDWEGDQRQFSFGYSVSGSGALYVNSEDSNVVTVCRVPMVCTA